MAVLQRQLFTLYPFLYAEGNTSTLLSSPVTSEQPVSINSHNPVMRFFPPSFSNVISRHKGKRRMNWCPGFGQDRINFHQNPGRDIARRADPTWPNRAGYSIPCNRHAGFRWGGAGQRELTRSSGVRGSGGRGERLSVFCSLCRIFSLSVSLLLLFPLFAVLLNCPYPDPPVSACFFPFSSAPRQGEGRPRGTFVAGRSQTITTGPSEVWP